MGNLNDLTIKSWIKAGEHFEGRSDGDGLTLCWPERYAAPFWKFRYRYQGKQRVMKIGDYGDLSLADARKVVKRLRAQVDLGHDVAGEKQERKADGKAKIEAEKLAQTVAQLADEYFERMIADRWKHPNIVRSRIEKDIKPSIGKLKIEDVKPLHIDAMLQSIVKRGARTVANDVLRWTRRMFDYAIKRHMIEINPVSAFDLSDAGGKEESRSRALSEEELIQFFAAMRVAQGFSRQNELTVKLLLLLAVRKMELLAAQWSEFDLDEGVWYLPGERTKTGAPIDIPLPAVAVEWLRELHEMAASSRWVLPARKMQHRMIPHIAESTLSVALAKVKHGLPHFTVHDFRRTARSHLAALGVQPHIAERCLNHKLKGVEGIYDRHDYFEERKAALNAWADLLAQLESGEREKIVPIRRRR
jgi:integrase